MKKLITYGMLLMGGPALGADFSKADFEKSLAAIKEHAKHDLSEDQIYQAALRGVLTQLEKMNAANPVMEEERANTLLAPRTVAELKNDLAGNVTGIGVMIKFDPETGQRYPLVQEVVKGGGASDAGIAAGDEVVKVDGKAIQDFESFQAVVYQLRGKEGSTVKLSLLRKGDIVVKSVKRKKIEWAPVEVSFPKANVAHLKIRYFNQKTTAHLADAIEAAKKKKAKSLVIDLRGCGGGSLEEGLGALRLFAKSGETLLTLTSRQGPETEKATQTGPGYGLENVVLVDNDTRSMCEAFAASLKSRDNTTVIGEPTFGKATVETLYDIGNGYSAKFTVAQMQDADGKTWQGSGIEPDVSLMATKEPTDSGLQAALSILAR